VSRRIPLSGVLLVQDNEDTVDAVLDQLLSICGEVVVVDGGSRDSTPDRVLARERTRLYPRPFSGNLAEQKNFALDQALGEWILLLDSDELLCREALAGIPRWIRSPWCRWYKFARLWLLPEEKGGPPQHFLKSPRHHPDWQLRLFRNAAPFRYDLGRSPVHHNFPKRGRGRGRKQAAAHLLHFDFLLKDRAAREAKVENYRTLDPASEATHAMYLWEDYPGAEAAELPACARGLEIRGGTGPGPG